MVVGNKTIKAEFTTLVDSGTNFALLEDPLYTQFTTAVSCKKFLQLHVKYSFTFIFYIYKTKFLLCIIFYSFLHRLRTEGLPILISH